MFEGFNGVLIKIYESAQIKVSCRPKFGFNFKPAVSYKLTPPGTTCPPAPLICSFQPIFILWTLSNIHKTIMKESYCSIYFQTPLFWSLSSQTSLVNDLSYFELHFNGRSFPHSQNLYNFCHDICIFRCFHCGYKWQNVVWGSVCESKVFYMTKKYKWWITTLDEALK